MTNLPAITYVAVVELDVPWDNNDPSWARELADVALTADHRVTGMRVLSLEPKVTPIDPDMTLDGQANDCRHGSATGVDTTPTDNPAKVWRCDHCGFRWRADGRTFSAELALRERDTALAERDEARAMHEASKTSARDFWQRVESLTAERDAALVKVAAVEALARKWFSDGVGADILTIEDAEEACIVQLTELLAANPPAPRGDDPRAVENVLRFKLAAVEAVCMDAEKHNIGVPGMAHRSTKTVAVGIDRIRTALAATPARSFQDDPDAETGESVGGGL